MKTSAAWLFTIATSVVVLFQLALAAGAPWGEWAMGGAYPGQFPPSLRVAAVVQAALLVGMALVVLTRAGLFTPRWARHARWLIWVVVAYGVIGLILNLITPSAGERAIWAPVAFVLLVSSALVASSKNRVNGS
ncbi:MAG: hypothetical protein ACOYNY_01410 [Caldilineaceae bacterium]